MTAFRDQFNRDVFLQDVPKRIVSVVPSQTELLFYLGLDDEIIGITNFCIYPHGKIKDKTKIGGTKQLNIELIKALKPDLIIANKEENNQAQIEELSAFCPVWISDIKDLTSAVNMINRVGEMIGRKTQAKVLCNDIYYRFSQLNQSALKLRVAYIIWRKPYMIAGTGTFINSMLQLCGLTNAFEAARYPQVDAAMLVSARPDVILLSSEPYPFKEKHVAEFMFMLPRAKVILVDGDMFSWYGSRLLFAPAYFLSLIKSLT